MAGESIESKRLILIGPMGAGKSTIGRTLASRSGLAFIDTDDLIASSAGLSISEIFDSEGEATLRAMEKKAVEEAISSDASIIACGGGTILDEQNAVRLRNAGKVVYLEIDASTAASRVGDVSSRPLLKKGDLVANLDRIIQERSAVYHERSDVVVDAGRSIDKIVRDLMGMLI
jgi:shikimate kinase